MDIFKELVPLLKEKNLTIACAESCTGGLLSSKITDVSGASSVFLGSVVSYTNPVKMKALGVKKSTIDKYSEVSYKCAKEMAYGIRTKLFSDIGVSITGVAGPTGGDEINPVGTVYVGFSFEDSLYSIRLSFPKHFSREKIKRSTCYVIGKMLVKKIHKKY